MTHQVMCELTARVRKVQPGADGSPQFQSFEASKSFSLNASEHGTHLRGPLVEARGLDQERGSQPPPPATCDPHLSMLPDRSYVLRVLGRAGEPIPGVMVRLEMQHRLQGGCSLR